MNFSKYLLRTLFIKHMKVVGALVSPKGITTRLVVPVSCPE